MIALYVSRFSCINHAELILSNLTIITGPQSSGKSLLTKIVHFFNEILNASMLNSLEKGNTFKQFEKDCVAEFIKWFPTGAWGDGEFEIHYRVDTTLVSARRKKMRTVVDIVDFEFDDFFKETYKHLLRNLNKHKQQDVKDSIDDDSEIIDSIYRIGRVKEAVFSNYIPSHIRYQLFIPAGRSFFTSITKAFAVFEAGGYLDPVTLRFGRSFGLWADSARSRVRSRPRDHERTFREYMPRVLGGNLHMRREERFVTSKDGRRVPFHLLSSGQQELIPLWISLEAFFGTKRRNSLVTIEEPEAHLFPSSQAIIINLLAVLIKSSDPSNRMIITTHSPYILSMINYIVKKSEVARLFDEDNQDVFKRIHEIDRGIFGELDGVNLDEGFVSAYAVRSGRLENITDESGLIDAKYLDQISFKVEGALNALFDIQFEFENI